MPIQPKGTARKATAPKPAPAPKKEPKSLISDSTYDTQEPTELKGSAVKSGFGSMTSGRHHGAIMALAGAVAYHGATLTEGGMSSSHKEGMNQLDKVYNHLAAHAKHHKVAEHNEAAGHLNAASKALNKAVKQFGGTRGTITNAYGETVQGRDIEATTNHLVNHYAQAHNAKIKRVEEPEKYNLPTKQQEERLEQKKTREKNLPAQGRAPVTRSEGGESSSGMPKLAPLSKMSSGSAVDMDKVRLPTMKETVVAAVNHYRKHGKMHPDHLKALPKNYHTEIPEFVEREKRAANEF